MQRSNSILIVEDDLDMAEIYRETLELLNYTVVLAHTGQQALDILNAQAPSVVVMDLTLPDMGWASVLTALRTFAQSHQIKLIVVSGRHDLAQIAQDYGAFAHLQKPFDISQLIKLLQP